jgi:hypothetical protein
MVEEIEDPIRGPLRLVANPLRFSATPPITRRPRHASVNIPKGSWESSDRALAPIKSDARRVRWRHRPLNVRTAQGSGSAQKGAVVRTGLSTACGSRRG